MDGGFYTEHGALLVVKLYRVLADGVFEAQPFRPVAKAANDLSGEVGANLSAEKAHYVRTGEGRDAMADESRIDLRQRGTITEYHIGSPFALVDTPVIAHSALWEESGEEGIEELGDAMERLRPMAFKLLVEKSLCGIDILNPRETVFAPAVSDASLVHLNRQPLATVDADLNVERKPALNSSMHETENRVQEVMVEEQTLSEAVHELKSLEARVATD
jgi:hypothetical protein